MCRPTTCSFCGRPSWVGCGAHVEQILGQVPKLDRCHCGAKTGASASKRTLHGRETAAVGADSKKKRWFHR